MLDLAAIRAQTPAAADQVFLDSAGSSLPPVRVTEAVVAHLRREAEIGGYRAAAERAEELAALPVALARLLGARPETIALTDSATRSWTQFVGALRLGPGDRVLIGGTEYAANAIALLQRARRDGCQVEVVPSDGDGRIDLQALDGMLDDRVRLVSLVHVPSTSGLVNPVAEVVALARRVGALVLLDACQSAGQLALDVDALGVDALTGTGRKWLRGPRGTGFLQVRAELIDGLDPVAADHRGATWTAADEFVLHPDASRFELWENDVAGRLGLKQAVDLLLELGPAEVEAAVRTGAASLRDALAGLPGVQVHEQGPDLCGIVSFTVAGVPAAEVRDALFAQRITVTVSPASSTLLDMRARGLDEVVRASPHYFVTPEQLDAAVAAVARIRPRR